MQAALGERIVTIFGAVEMLLPEHELRLLSSAGAVSFGGHRFVGRDPTFGAIDSIDVLDDGVGDEAPEITITLNPAGDAAATTLSSPAMQGALTSFWIGAVDPLSGAVIPDPLNVFLGTVDVPTIRSSAEGRKLELSVVSAFEEFFMDDEGARLSDTF
ncbi:hypothetical protein PYV61_26225, partial [Roseisolibacter sp. H3M3-2]|nr:hypothetical protein [Roseisolibacter sp. H3M3-2]